MRSSAIRWFWLAVALAFAGTAAVEVYLAVTMGAAWAWVLAGLLVLACAACVAAAFRPDRVGPPRGPGT
ncbi:hypothetical protein GCM10017786_25920 [Amycolatopsis deserti]|uniref:Uncharacterized protein n=1 Tax=Amycolatopsis deserti TaxID=185696 RepID=A0ABQ3ISE5_9PSEU|nr:hypothetical protein [Amycolatopsis deserti]GHE92098.1 hypothetical protein GCM10017786_25920 [Amycolatopsis deserti]